MKPEEMDAARNEAHAAISDVYYDRHVKGKDDQTREDLLEPESDSAMPMMNRDYDRLLESKGTVDTQLASEFSYRSKLREGGTPRVLANTYFASGLAKYREELLKASPEELQEKLKELTTGIITDSSVIKLALIDRLDVVLSEPGLSNENLLFYVERLVKMIRHTDEGLLAASSATKLLSKLPGIQLVTMSKPDETKERKGEKHA